MTEFQCKRCGFCCSNIRGPMLGAISGLTLLPDELHLFPRSLIQPFMRFKTDAPIKPGWAFVYQLDVKQCPHLENLSCNIYGRHPRTCKAFPFEIIGNAIAAHESCLEIAHLKRVAASCSIPQLAKRPAMEIHLWYSKWLSASNFRIERFDLRDYKWKEVTEGLTTEDIKWIRRPEHD